MEEYIDKDTYELSMGQKQRITIAGILSIKPKIIVMDEPTAMLDPEGKEAIRKIILNLKKQGFTIIFTSNIVEEIFISDRVIVLEKGQIIKEINEKDILNNIEFLKNKGVQISKTIEILNKLKEDGIKIDLEDLI